MKLLPYLNFNGNCAQAIAFYEKAFGAKAMVLCYKDALKYDPTCKIDKGKEKWVMHANMNLTDGEMIQFADCEENGKAVGTNICLQLTYNTADEVRLIFNALKSGGRIICDAQPTFYSPMYAELVDKFGIRWSIMQEMQA